MRLHPVRGCEMAAQIDVLEPTRTAIRNHHERWDGKGYPDGRKAEDIPVGARIVAVIDAYDAMTTDRPYRKAMPMEEAVSILRDGAGQQWDPTVVTVFLETVELHGDPTGDHFGSHEHDAEFTLPDEFRRSSGPH